MTERQLQQMLATHAPLHGEALARREGVAMDVHHVLRHEHDVFTT